MKRNVLILTIVLISIFIFSEPTIKDLKPSSPTYPHVIRMIENQIMTVDNQARFNGANPIIKYDLAVFGSKFLDYFKGKYGVKIKEFEDRLSILENMNLDKRISTLETSFYNYSEKSILIENNIDEINKKINDILMVIDPSSSINSNNAVFTEIENKAQKIAQKVALEELKRVSDTTLATVNEFSDRLSKFEQSVQDLNNKYDKSIEYLNTIIVSNEEKSRNELKNYVNQKLNIEIDALKASMRNIANSEVGYLNATLDATFSNLDSRINKLETNSNQKIDSYINGIDSRLLNLEAKINSIANFNSENIKTNTTGEILKIKTDIEVLRNTLNTLETSLKNLNNQNEYNKSYIDSFNLKEEYYTKKINEIEKKYDNLVSNLIFQSKKVDGIMFEMSKISTSNNINIDNSSLNERVASLERFFSNYSDEIKKVDIYSNDIDKTLNEFQTIKDQFKANNSKIENINNSFDTINTKIDSLSKILNIDSQKLKDIKNLYDVNEKILNNQNIIENLNKKSSNNEMSIIDLSQRLKTIENEINSFNVNTGKMDELNKSYGELLQEYYKIKSNVIFSINPDKMKDEITSTVENKIAIELANNNQKIMDLSKKIETLSTNSNNSEELTYNKKIEDNKSKLNKLEEEIKMLKKPQEVSFISSLTSGLIGVGVGAAITWILLSSGL
ncbi:hypothetical protein OSSY52_22790 [Tepiditoga spiralis]|uniref:VWFA domain-containing protein n=1 Tax=Tepiditoga spiralis TaxID=2108365 RepID=A0A7G1G6E4_9BACT|nr:hypothetical protein [Tepiditoga spiralis]BBE32138.1 hypothetical protein OSSY52_22790 [Tepiditoga spiralis]